MPNTMPDLMTAGRRLVLRLARAEEVALNGYRQKEYTKALAGLAEILRSEMFHSRKLASIFNGLEKFPPYYQPDNLTSSQLIARAMMERGLTTSDLAARMEGNPQRNLALLHLLFGDGGAIMGTAIEARIANALAEQR